MCKATNAGPVPVTTIESFYKKDSIRTHVESKMTIRYTNSKGLKFVIQVRLQGQRFVMVRVDFFSTRAPVLLKRRFSIPYGHDGIIPPFDFNGLELGIENMIDMAFKDSTNDEFKEEEMLEMIDILMMQEANVQNINLDVAYDVSHRVTV